MVEADTERLNQLFDTFDEWVAMLKALDPYIT